jgi:hypothetical protein
MFEWLKTNLTDPVEAASDRRIIFWFGLSLVISAVFSTLALSDGFQSPYVVGDDARQHIFWMERWLDPELFPGDIIADYYQSVSPPGFVALYWLMAEAGIEPILLSKLLPCVLGLVTTGYCFALCFEILSVPAAGFFGSLLLNQIVWSRPDLTSATPRAFIYPILLAFLFYLMRRSVVGCLTSIALQGLFYPTIAFVMSGLLILNLARIKDRNLRLTSDRRDFVICAIGVGLTIIIILFYSLKSGQVGQTVSAAEAKNFPFALAGPRLSFLRTDFWDYWLFNRESGLFARVFPLPAAAFVALVIPFMKRSMTSKINPQIRVLLLFILASLFMFFAAHALLFKLYLPSRYTQHTLIIVLSVAGGVAITIVLESILRWALSDNVRNKKTWAIVILILLVVLLTYYPFSINKFPSPFWVKGKAPDVYEFLSKQPKDSLVATLSLEANNLPTFSKRSVLVAPEYANPYVAHYYLELNQRLTDLFAAQYTTDPAVLSGFIEKYGIDYLILDEDAFTPEYLDERRTVRSLEKRADGLKERIEKGVLPFLSAVAEDCTALKSNGLIVLDAARILRATKKQ